MGTFCRITLTSMLGTQLERRPLLFCFLFCCLKAIRRKMGQASHDGSRRACLLWPMYCFHNFFDPKLCFQILLDKQQDKQISTDYIYFSFLLSNKINLRILDSSPSELWGNKKDQPETKLTNRRVVAVMVAHFVFLLSIQSFFSSCFSYQLDRETGTGNIPPPTPPLPCL